MSTHGKSKTKLYHVWHSMRQRCTNSKSLNYTNYGGRGITICPEWQEFEQFEKWSCENGYDESAEKRKCTLDRIDNNKGYSPDNCRWVDPKTQNNNKRNNRLITYKGKTQNLKRWTEELNLSYVVVSTRLDKRKWTVEKAFETPINTHIKAHENLKIGELELETSIPAGDVEYLKYLFKSKGLKVEDVAKILGISKQCLYRKLKGQHDWYLKDMKCLKELLEMSNDDFNKVFGF